jgi:ATP-independent RNA helicase DbpA
MANDRPCTAMNSTPLDFRSLPLLESLQKTIAQAGFTQMTPIQAACIPVLLSGSDLIGQSQTGSGKTAAFILPILQKTQLSVLKPQAIILCPTRELCDQVVREGRKFSQSLAGYRTVALVGGQEFAPQAQALAKGVHLIVGTPGRTLEHLMVRTVDLTQMRILVLDEADRMLEEGFTEQMTEILDLLPRERQTWFFSATFPEEMEELSRKYQKDPKRVTIQGQVQTAPQIQQYVYSAENPEKETTLLKILAQHRSQRTLIFCRTKATVKSISERLAEAQVSSQALHGDLEQNERDRITSLFRNGSLRVLVATDIVARGLDIEGLELVVNFDLPSSTEIYIHRIGRTGRAGRAGTAVTIATAYEASKVDDIQATTGVKMIRQNLASAPSTGFSKVLRESATKTIQISGGRNAKLRPGDILGALTGEPKPLAAADIGKIEIRDRISFVAISSSLADEALEKLRTVKIKGSKFKAYLVV